MIADGPIVMDELRRRTGLFAAGRFSEGAGPLMEEGAQKLDGVIAVMRDDL